MCVRAGMCTYMRVAMCTHSMRPCAPAPVCALACVHACVHASSFVSVKHI